MLQAFIIGNIGSDAVFHDENGRKYSTFRVGHNETYTDRDGNTHSSVTWVDVVMNDKPSVFDYLKSGQCVCVVGHVSLRVYSSEKDRCLKAGMTIRARSVELVGSRPDIVPSRLYDFDGVEHRVTKFYASDVKNAVLYSRNQQRFNADKNGWIKPEEPQQ